jgi:hypothetical protein
MAAHQTVRDSLKRFGHEISMVEMLQVLFPHMNFSDKCAFLTDIRLEQPNF